ncbi:MAG: hypothetical protein PWP16_1028 [Eubacteriaceae bacterium]|nr:hypothetical protein [Eubacteriaceae bacterium]MDK2937072.1 hypothetical protein [Eubacteriaceae bacterium]MDN5307665.1 hypothetical protein [Eubacteriaceae bacterium]
MSAMKNNPAFDVTDEMISSIVSLSATGVSGVERISLRITDEIKDKLSINNSLKGVKISRENENLDIWVYLITEPGVEIVKVSKEVQKKVKQAVESMAGIAVRAVNVRIEGSGM